MTGGSATWRERERKRKAHEQALDAYASCARSLMRILDMHKEAVDAWSSQVETANDKSACESATKALMGITCRKAMAETLLAKCCFDGGRRLDMGPGTWRDEIAAWAEGMASLASLSAARGAAEGALSSTATNVPVLVEIAISDASVELAANVTAAERAATGTVLDARPVDELATVLARLAKQLAQLMWAEAAGEWAAENVTALAAGAAVRASALRMGAAGVWAKASAEWSDVRDRAAADGDDGVANLTAELAKSAKGNETRLRHA